jgi:hypothetical protein
MCNRRTRPFKKIRYHRSHRREAGRLTRSWKVFEPNMLSKNGWWIHLDPLLKRR